MLPLILQTFRAWLNFLIELASVQPVNELPGPCWILWKGERPPLSALRSVIINFAKLRKFVTRHLHQDHLEVTRRDVLPAMLDIDEESIYTYAKYLEPMQTIQVKIVVKLLTRSSRHGMSDSLCHPLTSTSRTFKNTSALSILQGQDTIHKVLSSFRPVGFVNKISYLLYQPSLLTFDGPYQSYLLRLECTGNPPEP